jgi:hypothetical protein
MGGFGLLGTPADAACDINLPATNNCTGDCEVNVAGDCQGDCTVNVASTCGATDDCFLHVLTNCLGPNKNPNTVAVSGNGTIQPGLPCPGSGCDVQLAFTAAFTGPDVPGNAGTAACTFGGRDTYTDGMGGGATLLAGSGSGTISCSGAVSASGTVNFDRHGNAVTVNGSLTVNGKPCTTDVALIFVPGGTPPVTEFSVHGGGTVSC